MDISTIAVKDTEFNQEGHHMDEEIDYKNGRYCKEKSQYDEFEKILTLDKKCRYKKKKNW